MNVHRPYKTVALDLRIKFHDFTKLYLILTLKCTETKGNECYLLLRSIVCWPQQHPNTFKRNTAIFDLLHFDN